MITRTWVHGMDLFGQFEVVMIVVFKRHGRTFGSRNPFRALLLHFRGQQPLGAVHFDDGALEFGAIPGPVIIILQLDISGRIGPPEHARASGTSLQEVDLLNLGGYHGDCFRFLVGLRISHE